MATTGVISSLLRRIQKLENENRALKADARRLREENRRWARMAGTEALTGLPNKISFVRAMIPQTIQRASEAGKPVGFILLSADNLGDINETYGRQAGDQVIRGLGELLKSLLGDDDRVGHIDGTNFAVILYPADLDTVRGRSNMLRARVRAHGFPCADTTAQITISAGIMSIEPSADADRRALSEETFRLLNGALYMAKKAGGNRVEVVQSTNSDGGEAAR